MSSNRFIGPSEGLNATVSSTSYSKAFDIRTMLACAFFIDVGAGLTGQLEIEGSVDNVNFDTLGNVPVVPLTGVADTVIFDVPSTACGWIRAKITQTAGSAAVVVKFVSKGI